MRMFISIFLTLIVSTLANPAHGEEISRDFNEVFLFTGHDIGEHVSARVVELLQLVVKKNRVHKMECVSVGDDVVQVNRKDGGHTLLLTLGNCSATKRFIPDAEIDILPSESFRILSYFDKSHGYQVLASNGRRLDPRYTSTSTATKLSYGAIAGAYHALELLGFAFLHPLSPYIPQKLSLRSSEGSIHITEKPQWPIRIFHYHTQHPLELNEVLQGFDVPMFGPVGADCVRSRDYEAYNRNIYEDKTGRQSETHYCERWEDMVDGVNKLFEWAVANKYNRVEWLLLGNYKWKAFDDSDTRRKRMKLLTRLGHHYGLLIGADVPLGNIQQHGWYMVNPRLPFYQQVQQIHERVDWVFGAGFDFMTTESGLSEFTHPDCSLMKDLLEEFSKYVNVTWGREALVKVHCSTGQTCADYPDPRTGEPVNFNFLTMFADASLGVLPHTVQIYGLDDPTADSYGNKNFKEIEDYMYYEAELGNRSVVYYGESAYWVNVDIDVPLFLPIYAQRRLNDLRRIQSMERNTGHHINGQMVFDSGWEWGYWINAVVSARAAWNPLVHIEDEWEAFAESLRPITRLFPKAIGKKIETILVQLTRKQEELLIYGKVNGSDSPDLNKLSGIAYLSGYDTWVDVPRLFGVVLTQPDRIRMFETEDPQWQFVVPLLLEMETSFSEASAAMTSLLSELESVIRGIDRCLSDFNSPDGGLCNADDVVDSGLLKVLSEFDDSMKLLALRAKQVRLLYQGNAPETTHDEKAKLLTESRMTIATAHEVVDHRESEYRVPLDRVGAWRENPTVYRFTYLWAVHSLYYWWRDQGLAERGSVQSHYSPCYLNRMDASEVAVGWGKYTLELLRSLIQYYSPDSSRNPVEIINCIAPPSKEYKFPEDLYVH